MSCQDREEKLKCGGRRELMEKPDKRLKAWQLAMDITVDLYKASERFPVDERFGLISQIRRSAVSVPSNIAEGAGRNTKREFINFLP